jgi:hypothetical protein
LTTGDVSSGMPAGPTGCRGAVLAIVIVALLIALFIAAAWWALRDVGAL